MPDSLRLFYRWILVIFEHIKGTILWNIFFFKNCHFGCIDLWNDSGLQKITLKELGKSKFLMIFVFILAPVTRYVSMRKRDTRCIVPKLRGAHFEGSIIPQGAFEGSKTPRGKFAVNLCPAEFWSIPVAPCGIMEPSKCALLCLRPMQCVPCLVMGAKISTKKYSKT